jgi:general stress protein YciG
MNAAAVHRRAVGGSRLRSGCGRAGGQAAAPPRQQPGLDDELRPAGNRLDREHAQLRIVGGNRGQDEGDAADDGRAVGEQERPQIAKQRTAAQDDDELRRTGEGGPYAEDREDVATVPVAATPRATAATALTPALTRSSCRADPCWLRASATEATRSMSG